MVSPQKIQESLKQRVNNLLSGNPLGYAVEDSRQQSVEDIFSLLQRAEEELKAAQASVDRLKWELEKARS